LCLGVEVVEAVATALGEEDVRHLHVVEPDDIAAIDLLSGNAIVLKSSVREPRRLDQVPQRVADEFALVEVVRVIFEERFEVVVHLVWDFDIECAHVVTRVLRSEDQKRCVDAETIQHRCFSHSDIEPALSSTGAEIVLTASLPRFFSGHA